MRRTDDGIDPLEIADGWKKFARPNIQEFLFFFVLKFYVPGCRTAKKQWAEAEGCFGHYAEAGQISNV